MACRVAVWKARFLRGVTPIFSNISAGNHVNSEPASTNASMGGVTISSFFGLLATTLTLNTLMRYFVFSFSLGKPTLYRAAECRLQEANHPAQTVVTNHFVVM